MLSCVDVAAAMTLCVTFRSTRCFRHLAAAFVCMCIYLTYFIICDLAMCICLFIYKRVGGTIGGKTKETANQARVLGLVNLVQVSRQIGERVAQAHLHHMLLHVL